MNTTPLPSTAGTYFKTLRIMFFALFAGLIFFTVVAIFMRQTGSFPENFPYRNWLLGFIILFAVAGISSGILVYNRRLTSIREMSSLADKLSAYREALIIRYATVEAPSFFAIIGYLLTGNMIILGISLAIIAWFFTMKPSIEKIAEDLALNPEEKMKLENPDSAI